MSSSDIKQLTDVEEGEWLQSYITGLCTERDCEYVKSYNAWKALEYQFPNNAASLLNLATVHYAENRLDDAQYCFKKARVCDTLNIDKMDHV